MVICILKKLITVKEINEFVAAGAKEIFIDKNTLITPAAKDAAEENKIRFIDTIKVEDECKIVPQEKEKKVPVETKVENRALEKSENIDVDIIYKIVREVLAETLKNQLSQSFQKECDKSGLRLIRGDSVICDRFETGNENSKVGLKDIVSTKESPNMGAGFMTIEKSSFDWKLAYEEFDYIVEGNLDITINGKTYKGKQGDVFYIPKDSSITWSTADFAKFFYVTYPANWAELSDRK